MQEVLTTKKCLVYNDWKSLEIWVSLEFLILWEQEKKREFLFNYFLFVKTESMTKKFA